MINKELLQLTLQKIKDNPQHWNQGHWHCGTTHCFAGFVECLLLGIPFDEEQEEESGLDSELTEPRAIRALGISYLDADVLFYANNTLEDLEEMVQLLCDKGSLEDYLLEE